MQVTTKITVDMTRQNVGQRVNAVQGDGNTRLVEITLLSGGVPWTLPEGVDAAIAYMQPGGTKGLYNKLADGTEAISISGNVATVILAPQMLTVSGTVQASLVFNDAALNRLTTFPFAVSVTSNPAAGAQKTEDYIRLQWLEDKLDEYLRKAADSGEFDGAPGVPGKTPEYGVDYGTPEQIADIANQAAVILADDIQKISDGKVDKAEGMGLSSNDYNNAAKAKVDAIPEDPKYTDTVYDDTEVKRGLSQIKDDLSDLAPAGAAVGQLFRVAAISEDGKYTMEPVDMPSGGVTDVRIDGNSIVVDGVADVPFANGVNPGAVKVSSYTGLAINQNGVIRAKEANTDDIKYRRSPNMYNAGLLCADRIGDILRFGMTDGKDPAWTAEEQAAARERIGIPGDYELIEKIITTEETNGIERSVEPDGTPYSFISVFIKIHCPAADYTGTLNVRYYAENKNIIAYVVNAVDTVEKFGISKVITGNGYLEACGSVAASTAHASLLSILATTYSEYLTKQGYINKIFLNLQSSKILPVGTEILIYGVRP